MITLASLKEKKAQLVSQLHKSKNVTFAPGVSAGIKAAIIERNVALYRKQITAVQLQIDILYGRKEVPSKPLQSKFEATVLA